MAPEEKKGQQELESDQAVPSGHTERPADSDMTFYEIINWFYDPRQKTNRGNSATELCSHAKNNMGLTYELAIVEYAVGMKIRADEDRKPNLYEMRTIAKVILGGKSDYGKVRAPREEPEEDSEVIDEEPETKAPPKKAPKKEEKKTGEEKTYTHKEATDAAKDAFKEYKEKFLQEHAADMEAKEKEYKIREEPMEAAMADKEEQLKAAKKPKPPEKPEAAAIKIEEMEKKHRKEKDEVAAKILAMENALKEDGVKTKALKAENDAYKAKDEKRDKMFAEAQEYLKAAEKERDTYKNELDEVNKRMEEIHKKLKGITEAEKAKEPETAAEKTETKTSTYETTAVPEEEIEVTFPDYTSDEVEAILAASGMTRDEFNNYLNMHEGELTEVSHVGEDGIFYRPNGIAREYLEDLRSGKLSPPESISEEEPLENEHEQYIAVPADFNEDDRLNGSNELPIIPEEPIEVEHDYADSDEPVPEEPIDDEELETIKLENYDYPTEPTEPEQTYEDILVAGLKSDEPKGPEEGVGKSGSVKDVLLKEEHQQPQHLDGALPNIPPKAEGPKDGFIDSGALPRKKLDGQQPIVVSMEPEAKDGSTTKVIITGSIVDKSNIDMQGADVTITDSKVNEGRAEERKDGEHLPDDEEFANEIASAPGIGAWKARQEAKRKAEEAETEKPVTPSMAELAVGDVLAQKKDEKPKKKRKNFGDGFSGN